MVAGVLIALVFVSLATPVFSNSLIVVMRDGSDVSLWPAAKLEIGDGVLLGFRGQPFDTTSATALRAREIQDIQQSGKSVRIRAVRLDQAAAHAATELGLMAVVRQDRLLGGTDLVAVGSGLRTRIGEPHLFYDWEIRSNHRISPDRSQTVLVFDGSSWKETSWPRLAGGLSDADVQRWGQQALGGVLVLGALSSLIAMHIDDPGAARVLSHVGWVSVGIAGLLAAVAGSSSQ